MKIASRIVMVLLLPLILIGGTNYSIDPDYSLGNGYISPLITSLLEGKMLTGPANVNSRLLKKEWIRRLPHTPEVLVLGSSRTLALSQQVFEGRSYFNASVTNCTFQDMMAFLNMIEKKKDRLPSTIVICTDQWLFGNAFTEKRWLENRSEAMKMIQKMGVNPSNQFPFRWSLEKEWIKELFSVRYMVRSIENYDKVEKFEPYSSLNTEKMIFLPDGSRSVPPRVINAPEAQIAQEAHNYFYESKDEYFTELDKIQCELFEHLVQYLTSNHCKVILFIPPYHPKTLQLLGQSNQTSGVFKAESYLKDYAHAHQLQLIGGNDASSLNLSSADFHDGVHLKPETLNRFFKSQIDGLEPISTRLQ